jgi:predicted S18 family serine protease
MLNRDRVVDQVVALVLALLAAPVSPPETRSEPARFISGPALAVGIIAAWRGNTIRSGVVLTGVITPDGRIKEVSDLPIKLQGAVAANRRAMLVLTGEARTSEWDLFELGQQRNIRVVEVGTLEEAYEMMTGIRP